MLFHSFFERIAWDAVSIEKYYLKGFHTFETCYILLKVFKMAHVDSYCIFTHLQLYTLHIISTVILVLMLYMIIVLFEEWAPWEYLVTFWIKTSRVDWWHNRCCLVKSYIKKGIDVFSNHFDVSYFHWFPPRPLGGGITNEDAFCPLEQDPKKDCIRLAFSGF